MAKETITVHVDPGLGIGDVLTWLPVITQAVLTYPELGTAKVGETLNSPVIPGLRIAGGHFDLLLSFTKKA